MLGAPSNLLNGSFCPSFKNYKNLSFPLLEPFTLLLLFFFASFSSTLLLLFFSASPAACLRHLPSRQVSLTFLCFYYALQLQHLGQVSGTLGQKTPKKMGESCSLFIYSNVTLFLIDVRLKYFPTHPLTHNTYWAWCVNNKWWVLVTADARTRSQVRACSDTILE